MPYIYIYTICLIYVNKEQILLNLSKYVGLFINKHAYYIKFNQETKILIIIEQEEEEENENEKKNFLS
jgi:hypothetical protein